MAEVTAVRNENGDGVAPVGTFHQIIAALSIFIEFLIMNVHSWLYVFQSMFLVFYPPEEKSVAGEIVLITGTGHGIGRELALKLAKLGSIVVCVDINEEGNAETVKLIKSLGAVKVHAYRCDVSNREEVLAMAAKVAQEVGPVSVLFNNAGIMPTRPFLEQTPEEMRKTFDINVMAHFWLLQAFLPGMQERAHGHVVATSSMCGQMGVPNLAPYCASKYAVRGLMESLCVEQYEQRRDLADKVHYTTIYPYIVNTGLVKRYETRFRNFLDAMQPSLVAEEIVSAMRRNELEVSIPSWMFHFNKITRLFPNKAQMLSREFFKTKVLDG